MTYYQRETMSESLVLTILFMGLVCNSFAVRSDTEISHHQFTPTARIRLFLSPDDCFASLSSLLNTVVLS